MAQPTYYYRLQKALGVMAHRVGKEERIIPLYYFDMKPKEAVRKELPTHHLMPKKTPSISFVPLSLLP